MSLSLASILTESNNHFASEIAMIHDDRKWTYKELTQAVLSFAAYLHSMGVRRGSKVALMCGNHPDFTIAYFGILSAGATVVSLNNLLVADEVAYQLQNSESIGVVTDIDCLATVLASMERVEMCEWVILAEMERPSRPSEAKRLPLLGEIIENFDPLDFYIATYPEDTAVIMYTSGTTGFPKGAELTHFNLWENARQLSERAFANSPRDAALLGPGNVAIAVLPLFHSFGQTCVQNALLFNGGAITYLRKFDPQQAASIIQRDRVNILDAVPTIYNALGNDSSINPDQLKTLQYGISGGAGLPLEVRKAFEDQFKVSLQEGYGLTETSPVASFQRRYYPLKPGSIGRPIRGCQMKIVDENDRDLPPGKEGEVVIRGRNIMKGYLNHREATAVALKGGWFHTGDIGKCDEDGDFYIVDRKKDMILRGGFNVYPREVEEVLYAHPAVREAGVIGVPDKYYGEEVKAVVSLHENQGVSAEDLIAYCKQHVAAFKYPRIIEIISDLPKGPTGKILKREIRRLYGKSTEKDQ